MKTYWAKELALKCEGEFNTPVYLRIDIQARDAALAKQSRSVLLMLTLPFNHWPREAQAEYNSWARLERSKPMSSIQYFIIDKLTEIEVALRGDEA